MKLTLACLGFTLCFALVWGEGCRDVSDCQYEHCTGDGWSESCVVGTCTCEHGTHTGSKCTTGADCAGTRCLGSSFGDRFFKPHCVDNACRCTFSNLGPGK